jgi:hypothetical protein
LDRSYISYFYFSLPPLNRRKLDKILQFELADMLIRDIDQYFYDYRSTNLKNEETQIGIYIISKELVNHLVQKCKTHNLELRTIHSLNDLLDLKIRGSSLPVNELIATADRYVANLLVYRNGFLVGFSNQKVPDHLTGDLDNSNDQENGYPLKELNWKIKAIALKENGISSIRISDETGSFLKLNEQNELSVSINEKNGVPTILCSDLIHSNQFKRTNRINLLKSNVFVLHELKKQVKKILLLFITFGIGVILYASTLVYQSMVSKNRYQMLEKLYTETVLDYLPKGTSTANALRILQDQVDNLKKLKQQNQKFVKREYPISQQLNELSLLRQQIPSLLLTRFYLTEQSIRIEGEVATFAAYDRVKIGFEKIYSYRNTLKFNQKSVGEDIVEFSVSIRPNQQ